MQTVAINTANTVNSPTPNPQKGLRSSRILSASIRQAMTLRQATETSFAVLVPKT